MSQNFAHPDIIRRLKRAAGHLNKIVTMTEEKKDGLFLAQQLQAVEGAVTKAKKNLIHDYINHHLEQGAKLKNPGKMLNDLKEITQYL